MLAQSFEIKVGLLGHVSVGKTTGLNALLREKFSEVSMKRTTAGINLFRISSLAKSAKRTKLSMRNEESIDWQEVDCAESESSYAKASDTLQETTSDNARLRKTNELQEKIFDIELDEPLLRDMRDDTRLVLVDIPGTNEAGTQKIYQDYVSSTWDTFDAMIVVMDAKHGVNTDEQVGLLDFVKKNLDSKKDIPIIVVCNKVDDPDDDELMSLVMESQREVERIFAVDDRSKALQAIVGGEANHQGQISPAFFPVSFENAFLYRTASGLPMEELKRLDKVYIDKIGHEEMNKVNWRKLSDEEKYEFVHKIVSDPVQYKERLEASNFHTLLSCVQYFLEGKATQENLIEKQLDVALSKMSIGNSDGQLFTDKLIAVFDRSIALGKHTSGLIPKFWALYKDIKAEAFAKLKSNPLKVNTLSAPMKELIKYAENLQNKLVQCHPSITEYENRTRIVDAMKELIKHQITIIIQKADGWEPQRLSKVSRTLSSWSGMSPRDWSAVVSSISMLSHRKPFHENFGQQIADLDWMVRNATFAKPPEYCTSCRSTVCKTDCRYNSSGGLFEVEHERPFRDYLRYEGGTYDDNGVFTPANKDQYDRVVHVKVPDHPSDPSHWGHLAWLFCEYMESVEA